MTVSPSTWTFRFGEGQISGFLSTLLGCLGLLAVLCFRWPWLLTTPELHRHYSVPAMRIALLVALTAAFALGLVNFLIGRWRTWGYIGLVTATLATALGGAAVEADGTPTLRVLPIGLDWFILGLLSSAVIFIPIERSLPLRRELSILREGWGLDLGYFAQTHLLLSLITIVTTTAAMGAFSWALNAQLQGAIQSLPWVLQFAMVLLCADLAQYWSHRLMHTVPALWRVHAIHHSSTCMDWLASSRLHLCEVLITRFCVFVPLYVCGFSPSVLLAYVIYIGLHAVLVHANLRLDFGPLRYLLVTPVFHHWHHSDEQRAMNTNFAVHLPVLDKLFGTYFQPKGEWPATYGIGPEPLPRGFFRQFLYPFSPRRR